MLYIHDFSLWLRSGSNPADGGMLRSVIPPPPTKKDIYKGVISHISGVKCIKIWFIKPKDSIKKSFHQIHYFLKSFIFFRVLDWGDY